MLPSALLPSAPSLLSLPPLSDSLSELQMSTSLLLSELLLPELPSELLSSVPPGALPLLGELLSSEAVCDIELLSELPLSLKGEAACHRVAFPGCVSPMRCPLRSGAS